MSAMRTNPFHCQSQFVTSRPVNGVPKERQHGDAAGGMRDRHPRREVPFPAPPVPRRRPQEKMAHKAEAMKCPQDRQFHFIAGASSSP